MLRSSRRPAFAVGGRDVLSPGCRSGVADTPTMTGHLERAGPVSSNIPTGQPASLEPDGAPAPEAGPAEEAGPGGGTAPAEQARSTPVRETPRRPRTSTVVLSVLLSLVVAAGGLGFFWLSTQLQEARTQIGDQQRQITDQQRQIDEQDEMIERKEQFGAAMDDLYATVEPLVGLPFATLVPWYRAEDLADRAWIHRRNPDSLDGDIRDLRALTSQISARTAGVGDQAGSNASGTAWEAALDTLGRGWVRTVFDDGGTPCGSTALACVSGEDPFTVHVRASTQTDPTMTEWIRTGAAYHEYAHVLQFTNPQDTDAALATFDGDAETMADCFALTFLDGWSLDHEVTIDDSSYYEVSVGYGYTCNANERQVIRDWVAGLGIERQPVGG